MSTLPRYRLPTETEMEYAIREAVGFRGGVVWHARDSRGQGIEDEPDLRLVLPWKRTVAFVELKSQRRVITPGQALALALIAECTRLEQMIVRPDPQPGEIGYSDFMRWLGAD